MNYAKDYQNDNHYVSVNTLIKPQRKSNLSLVSEDTAMEQPESVQAADTLMNSNAGTAPSGPENPAELDPGQAANQTAPALDHPVQGNETIPATGAQNPLNADRAAENMETGSMESESIESTADSPVQGAETSTAEPVETGASPLPESETIPQVEETFKLEEETKSGKESNRPKPKMMTAAASGADPDTGSRPLETVQLAGESTVSGNDDGLSVTRNTLSSMENNGEPLPEGLQQNMGNAMGTDFENVRIHRDGQTVAIAGQLGAKAFTRNEDIYFNQGQYNPDTPGGRHLIAHELAHVEQQRTIPGLQYKLEVPAERDRYEQEADVVADKAVNSPVLVQKLPFQKPVAARSGGLNSSVQLKEDTTNNSNWILNQVGGFLRNIPGYDVLTLIIGRDPLTGQEVKRDGIGFARAIIGLIPGGKALFENLERAGVISRAVVWFKEEFQKLNISFATIRNMFVQVWESIFGKPESGGGFFSKLGKAIVNAGKALLSPKETFEKIKHIFLGPIQRIMNFLGAAGSKLMEFIFEGALTLAGAPVKAIMGILNKGKEVLGKIIKDPIGFLKNLLSAVKGGLGSFAGNIVTHLQNGIGGWIFGALGKAGLTLPEKLNLAGIFHVAAQVLGVTWQAIKTLVAKRLGPIADKVMNTIEKSVDFVVTFITKGPMALLDMAKDFLAELKTLFFDTLIEWVRNTIIVKAIQKLISMFNPVGAIIQAVITIYNTIQFFIERAKQIAAFVGAVFNSIAEIAGGNIGKAVAAVENALAKGVPVAISFLANLIGLGGIAKKVLEIIKKIRKPIDKVIGKVVGFVVDKAKQIWGKIQGIGKKKKEPPKNEAEHDAQVKAGLAALDGEQRKVDKDKDNALTFEEAEDVAKKVKQQYPVFKSITVVDGGDSWNYKYVASSGEKKGLKKQKNRSLEDLEKEIVAKLTTDPNAFLLKIGDFGKFHGSIETKKDETTPKERADIQLLGKQYGCHITGKTNLDKYIADHQAPSGLFHLAEKNKYVYNLLLKHGVVVDRERRLYPQSPTLSNRQGPFVKNLIKDLEELIKLRGE
jgi:hypothetical protein